jgi:hypothetical protein
MSTTPPPTPAPSQEDLNLVALIARMAVDHYLCAKDENYLKSPEAAEVERKACEFVAAHCARREEALSSRDALIVQMRGELKASLEEHRQAVMDFKIIPFTARTNVNALADCDVKKGEQMMAKIVAALALVPSELAGKVLVDAGELACWKSAAENAPVELNKLQAELSLAKAKISELEKAK